MRKIILYAAYSLDGYLAKSDGSVAWLKGQGDIENPDLGYDAFLATIDTVIMGRTTYQQLITELSPGKWVYPDKKCYVVASEPMEFDANIEVITNDLIEFFKDSKQQDGQDIWLVGGAKLIDLFMQEGLIDKYIVTIIPTLLGSGIPLFIGGYPEVKLRLSGVKSIDGMVELTYVKREIPLGSI